MADNHVCSFCNEDLKGKQHIKIVFENWPVEEVVIFERKGKEKRKTQKLTKEVITAIGMECLKDPERWREFDIDPSKVSDFFEDLRFAGKNPTLAIAVDGDDARCVTNDCRHRNDEYCSHLSFGGSDISGMERAICSVGHPGHYYFEEPPLPFKYRIVRLRDFIRSLNPVSMWRAFGTVTKEPMGLVLFLWSFTLYAITPVYYTLSVLQRIKWEMRRIAK